jgi:hypothetical protein
MESTYLFIFVGHEHEKYQLKFFSRVIIIDWKNESRDWSKIINDVKNQGYEIYAFLYHIEIIGIVKLEK